MMTDTSSSEDDFEEEDVQLSQYSLLAKTKGIEAARGTARTLVKHCHIVQLLQVLDTALTILSTHNMHVRCVATEWERGKLREKWTSSSQEKKKKKMVLFIFFQFSFLTFHHLVFCCSCFHCFLSRHSC